MEQGRLWLGRSPFEELLSPEGRTFMETDVELTREDRTASGRLVVDVIARKKRFTLTYSLVTESVLEQLRSLYGLGGILQLKVERSGGLVDEYAVKLRPFGRSRYLMRGEWLWEGITLEMEEI